MKMNIKNILVIAQKEFADIIWGPRFIVILAVLMVAVLASGYQAGQSMARMAEQGGFVGMGMTLSPLMIGFQSFIYSVQLEHWLLLYWVLTLSSGSESQAR